MATQREPTIEIELGDAERDGVANHQLLAEEQGPNDASFLPMSISPKNEAVSSEIEEHTPVANVKPRD